MPTADPAELDALQQGYLVLITAQAVAETIDEVALQLQADEIASFEAGLTLLALSGYVTAIDEKLAEPAPHGAIEGPWETARSAMPGLKDVIARWLDKEISSATVPDKIAPVIAQLAQAASDVEAVLSIRYLVPRAELEQLRQETVAEMREIVQPSGEE